MNDPIVITIPMTAGLATTTHWIPAAATNAWAMGGRICDLADRHLSAIATAIATAKRLPPVLAAAQKQVNTPRPQLIRVTTEKWISDELEDDGQKVGHVPSMRRGHEIGAGAWLIEFVVSTQWAGRAWSHRTSFIDRGTPLPAARVAGIWDRLEQRVLGAIELEGYQARA